MLFQILRSLVLGLLSVMLLPAVALATIGPPSIAAGPAAVAGWVVLATVGATLLYVFISDAWSARLAVDVAPNSTPAHDA